jgi:hypothetical protein|tara:strand:+ start:110 stop:733 length:624 start_codon:yes stop_codon:yes gene_type:complete
MAKIKIQLRKALKSAVLEMIDDNSGDEMFNKLMALNEGPYCNPDGANASTVAGCREIGVGCLGDGFFGVMGYCGSCPADDMWACVGSVAPGGTGGGPLNGDDLVVKTKGGNTNQSYNPKPSIDKMMREASINIVKEAELRKYYCYKCKGGFFKGSCVHNASTLAPHGQRPSDCQSKAECEADCTRSGGMSQSKAIKTVAEAIKKLKK